MQGITLTSIGWPTNDKPSTWSNGDDGHFSSHQHQHHHHSYQYHFSELRLGGLGVLVRSISGISHSTGRIFSGHFIPRNWGGDICGGVRRGCMAWHGMAWHGMIWLGWGRREGMREGGRGEGTGGYRDLFGQAHSGCSFGRLFFSPLLLIDSVLVVIAVHSPSVLFSFLSFIPRDTHRAYLGLPLTCLGPSRGRYFSGRDAARRQARPMLLLWLSRFFAAPRPLIFLRLLICASIILR